MRFEIHDLEQAVRNLKASFPELADDDEFFADVLEGETDFRTVIGKLVDQSREQKAHAAAVKSMADALVARRAVWEFREKATRALIQRIMNIADQRKLVLPQATISIANGRAGVAIIDESLLPDEAFVIEKKVSKTKVRDMLDCGVVLDGAVLTNGSETLIIR